MISFGNLGTGKIPYLSLKVQLYFPIQGTAVVVKKNFPIRGFAAHGEIFFHYSCAPFMGKYNCTFRDSQGISKSSTRGFATRRGFSDPKFQNDIIVTKVTLDAFQVINDFQSDFFFNISLAIACLFKVFTAKTVFYVKPVSKSFLW